MAKNKHCYAVYGENGFGVYLNYNTAFSTRNYLSKFKIKKFDFLEIAWNFAIHGYNDLQPLDDYDSHYNFESASRLNWIYYRNEVRKMNTLKERSN